MAATLNPVVQTTMLLRVPVERVFEALVDPEITTRFWFTHSSGQLAAGESVTWEWRMFGVSTIVHVSELEPNRRIIMRWGDEGAQTTVEWTFASRPDGTTLVEVANYGFQGTDEQIVNQAVDSSGGFALVLSNAKALLEHGINLNLIADRFPPDAGANP